MKNRYFGIALVFSLVIFQACNENPIEGYNPSEHEILSEKLNLPEKVLDYSVVQPAHTAAVFPQIDHGDPTFQSEINNIATLGRVLFYDTQLSSNNKVSCASCHDQKKGFGDDKPTSEGFMGEFGHRNSLALASTIGFESAYGGGESIDFGIEPLIKFSWDDSVNDLQEQSRLAITSEIEMGMTMEEVVGRIKDDKAYAILFKRAFGTLEADEHLVLEALRTFVNSIASVNTKFDQELDKILSSQTGHFNPFENFAGFTAQENEGKRLFNENCSSCHSNSHVVAFIPIANNGLDMIYEDKGKGAKTGNEFEEGMFKIPFLRNIAVTGPYMHDGRFESLEEVVDHYSDGVQNHKNLAAELKVFDGNDPAGSPKKFNFSSNEKSALVAYLNTLTDDELAVAEKFSDPFKR